MPESNHHLWGALLRNEWEKIWAHRGRALVIVWMLIVVGGVWIAYHSEQSAQQGYHANMVSLQAQIQSWRHQEIGASRQTRRLLQSQIAGAQTTLQQMQSSVRGVNEVTTIPVLKQELKTALKSSRGEILEQLALAQDMVAHGIDQARPSAGNGIDLVGSVFSGTALLLFALVAVGLSSDRISSELEGGTWGGLLLHAPRRAQLYTAKLLAAVTTVWAFMAAAALGFFGLASLVMGIGPVNAPVVVGLRQTLSTNPNFAGLMIPVQTFHLMPQWRYDLWALVLSMLALGVLVSLFVGLSVVTRSTVFSFIVSTVIVLSGVLAAVVARAASWLVVIDPAVHLPLAADWTGRLAQQYTLPALTLRTGSVVLAVWAVVAIAVGVWATRRLDV